MDPITAAIVAGLAAGAGKVGSSTITDAYDGLKRLLTEKFGGTKVVKAVTDHDEHLTRAYGEIALCERLRKPAGRYHGTDDI